MNKRYIDFVPAKAAQTTKAVPEKKPAETPKKQSVAVKKEVDELELNEIFVAKNEKPRAGVTTGKKTAPSNAFKVPRVRFVNTEKVTKRPLSKNVYPKKVVMPKVEAEKPQKPVTIINKPEKDSKMGMIVAIIITIILGAAAGTVAFLLLPS